MFTHAVTVKLNLPSIPDLNICLISIFYYNKLLLLLKKQLYSSRNFFYYN